MFAQQSFSVRSFLRNNTLRNIAQKAVLVGIIVVAVGIRLVNYPHDIEFKTDQASDLLIAHSIVYDHHRPLLGPILSVGGFHTPPTYYYILAALYSVGTSPEGVVLLLIALHPFILLLVYGIGNSLGGSLYALLVTGLFAASSMMDYQSRTMWQPNLVTVFLLLYLELLLLADKKKNVWYLLGSLLVFSAGLSIYPTVLVILPHAVYSVYSFFRRANNSTTTAFILSLLYVGCSVIFFLIPVIVFELNNGYPMIRSIGSGAFGLPGSISGFYDRYRMNLISIFDDIFRLRAFIPQWYKPVQIGLFGVFVYWYGVVGTYSGEHQTQGHRYRRILTFLGVPWLIVGFLPVVLYQLEIHSHRLWAFIPFLLLYVGLCLRLAFERMSVFFRHSVIVVCFLFLLSNAALVGIRLFSPWNIDLSTLHRQITYMHDAAVSRGVSVSDFDIVSYLPDDKQNFEIFPYLYYLHAAYAYPVSYLHEGNDVDRGEMNYPTKSYVFLTCTYYPSVETVRKDCLRYFMNQHDAYELQSQKLFERNMMIFIFRKIPD